MHIFLYSNSEQRHLTIRFLRLAQIVVYATCFRGLAEVWFKMIVEIEGRSMPLCKSESARLECLMRPLSETVIQPQRAGQEHAPFTMSGKHSSLPRVSQRLGYRVCPFRGAVLALETAFHSRTGSEAAGPGFCSATRSAADVWD
jgi:hypothetical protein